jgi:hypothetical protein
VCDHEGMCASYPPRLCALFAVFVRCLRAICLVLWRIVLCKMFGPTLRRQGCRVSASARSVIMTECNKRNSLQPEPLMLYGGGGLELYTLLKLEQARDATRRQDSGERPPVEILPKPEYSTSGPLCRDLKLRCRGGATVCPPRMIAAPTDCRLSAQKWTTTRTASLSASHSSPGLPPRRGPRQSARCCLRLFCRMLSVVCRNCTCMRVW